MTGTLLLADPVIGLVFGGAYEPSAASLRWLAPALPLVAVGSLTASLLTAVHRQADVTRVTLLLVAVNALANAWAIPRYGFAGAAAATTATELVGAAALLWIARPLWSARAPRAVRSGA